MSLKDKINNDLKDAMRSGDKLRLSTIRSLRALILNFDISALHNEIYKKRAEQLQAYLKNEKVKKKEKSSDNL